MNPELQNDIKNELRNELHAIFFGSPDLQELPVTFTLWSLSAQLTVRLYLNDERETFRAYVEMQTRRTDGNAIAFSIDLANVNRLDVDGLELLGRVLVRTGRLQDAVVAAGRRWSDAEIADREARRAESERRFQIVKASQPSDDQVVQPKRVTWASVPGCRVWSRRYGLGTIIEYLPRTASVKIVWDNDWANDSTMRRHEAKESLLWIKS